MVFEHHKHDYDQYLNFPGGDPTNMLKLNGELELYLSLDGVNLKYHSLHRVQSCRHVGGFWLQHKATAGGMAFIADREERSDR